MYLESVPSTSLISLVLTLMLLFPLQVPLTAATPVSSPPNGEIDLDNGPDGINTTPNSRSAPNDLLTADTNDCRNKGQICVNELDCCVSPTPPFPHLCTAVHSDYCILISLFRNLLCSFRILLASLSKFFLSPFPPSSHIHHHSLLIPLSTSFPLTHQLIIKPIY